MTFSYPNICISEKAMNVIGMAPVVCRRATVPFRSTEELSELKDNRVLALL